MIMNFIQHELIKKFIQEFILLNDGQNIPTSQKKIIEIPIIQYLMFNINRFYKILHFLVSEQIHIK